MPCIFKIRHLTALSLSLMCPLLGLPAIAAPTPTPTLLARVAGIGIKFNAPKTGAPPATAGGATRGFCLSESANFTALTPKDHIAQTLAARPSFFFLMPETGAKSADFLLLNRDGSQVVYQTTFQLPQKSGVVQFDLPADAPELAVSERYQWFVTLNCSQALGPSGNPTVEGWVERVAPEPQLLGRLEATSMDARPGVYANFGIWNETLKTLATLQRQNPNNRQWQTDWQELLRSVGLDAAATAPLVN